MEDQVQSFKEETQLSNLPNDEILKKRVYAFFLDLIFISLLNRAIIYSYLNFIDRYLPYVNQDIKARVLTNFSKINFPIYMLVFLSYFMISYYISNGKTPAKVIFGLKVHGKDILNDNISLRESFLRASCYLIGTTFGFFILAIPLFKNNRKGIPDIISNTEVYTEEQLKLKKEQLKHMFEKENQEISENSEDQQLQLFVS